MRLTPTSGKFRTTTAIAVSPLSTSLCVSVCVCHACADNCGKSMAQKFNWQQHYKRRQTDRQEAEKRRLGSPSAKIATPTAAGSDYENAGRQGVKQSTRDKAQGTGHRASGTRHSACAKGSRANKGDGGGSRLTAISAGCTRPRAA